MPPFQGKAACTRRWLASKRPPLSVHFVTPIGHPTVVEAVTQVKDECATGVVPDLERPSVIECQQRNSPNSLRCSPELKRQPGAKHRRHSHLNPPINESLYAGILMCQRARLKKASESPSMTQEHTKGTIKGSCMTISQSQDQSPQRD